MNRRIALLATLLTPTLSAQFSGLSSTVDGSSLYFASTLRLKNTTQPLNGKIFVTSHDTVQLFRATDRAPAPAGSRPCTVGGFNDYVSAETSSTGISYLPRRPRGHVVALTYRANSIDGCSFPVNPFLTEIVTASGTIQVPGVVRLSAAGRDAIVFLAASGRPFSPVAISYLDLHTSVQTPVQIAAPPFPQYLRVPDGRVISNDGTALLAVTDGSTQNSGYLLKPGAAPQPFPVADALPLMIDAAASKVLYQTPARDLRLLDLRTLQSTLLLPADRAVYGLRISDDAGRLLFLQDGQAHVLDTATLVDRPLTSDAAKITEAAISGDGKIVYAVTGRGGLLKIKADTGTQTELIGHTPYLDPTFVNLVPGLTTTLNGSGLSDSVMNAAPPLPAQLGSVTVSVGDRRVPIIQVAPNTLRFLAPWDIAGPVRIVAEVPGDRTPFDFPEVDTVVGPIYPRAGAIYRQDWQSTFVGPINTGEVIHVFAIGFGPVSPEVPAGAPAPSAEPFARLTRPLACSNAEILYAGLAPATIERVYQIDLRIGPTPGYQKFTCTLAGADPFLFLTLNIAP